MLAKTLPKFKINDGNFGRNNEKGQVGTGTTPQDASFAVENFKNQTDPLGTIGSVSMMHATYLQHHGRHCPQRLALGPETDAISAVQLPEALRHP